MLTQAHHFAACFETLLLLYYILIVNASSLSLGKVFLMGLFTLNYLPSNFVIFLHFFLFSYFKNELFLINNKITQKIFYYQTKKINIYTYVMQRLAGHNMRTVQIFKRVDHHVFLENILPYKLFTPTHFW
jgi:hypothetical protein